jgi:hypothetical protein
VIQIVYKTNSGKKVVDTVENKEEGARWIEERAMLAKVIGLATLKSKHMLHILDSSEPLAIYYCRTVN